MLVIVQFIPHSVLMIIGNMIGMNIEIEESLNNLTTSYTVNESQRYEWSYLPNHWGY
jgi:uncharacterized membrane protein YqgA involved in biofilm formation